MRGDKLVIEEGHTEAARRIMELLLPTWNLIILHRIWHTACNQLTGYLANA